MMRKCEKAPLLYSLVEKLTFLRPGPASKIVHKKSAYLVEFTDRIFLFIFLATPVQKCTCFGGLRKSTHIRMALSKRLCP